MLPPETMVGTWPVLPLEATPGNSGLLPPKARQTSLVWAANCGLVDVQGLCRTGPSPPLGVGGELALQV